MKKIDLGIEVGFPSGVKYPLLVLRGVERVKGKDEPRVLWIEVDGKVDLFITQGGMKKAKYGHINVINYARAKFKRMLKRLGEYMYLIDEVNIYTGSGGPSHILRNGILHVRMDEDVNVV